MLHKLSFSKLAAKIYFGINFVGHPNLKRILNVDEMDYFPMRKEFPLEDQTRIDKDDEMFGRG